MDLSAAWAHALLLLGSRLLPYYLGHTPKTPLDGGGAKRIVSEDVLLYHKNTTSSSLVLALWLSARQSLRSDTYLPHVLPSFSK